MILLLLRTDTRRRSDSLVLDTIPLLLLYELVVPLLPLPTFPKHAVVPTLPLPVVSKHLVAPLLLIPKYFVVALTVSVPHRLVLPLMLLSVSDGLVFPLSLLSFSDGLVFPLLLLSFSDGLVFSLITLSLLDYHLILHSLEL
jgi:hypothetical protein